jgi:hypothetical protein
MIGHSIHYLLSISLSTSGQQTETLTPSNSMQMLLGVSLTGILTHILLTCNNILTELLSSDTTKRMIWNTTRTSNSVYHQAQQNAITALTENNDIAEDGTMYFGFTAVSASIICHLASSSNIDTMTRPQESQ